MNEIEQAILRALRELSDLPIRIFSYDIAAAIDKSARQARNYLARLEKIGLVKRPNGKNSGWVLA